MKKLILGLGLLSFISVASFANTDTDKQAMKKQYKEDCVKGMVETGGLDEATAKTFCDCNTEAVFSKLTDEDLTIILEKPEEATEEMQVKAMEAAQPCIEELMKSMGQAE